MKPHILLSSIAVTLAAAAVIAAADDFEITRYTVDCGGGYSAGGNFDLEGTIGQHDAGYMAGGDFELSGGYWTTAASNCACPGDANGDQKVDGADVQSFVQCFITPGDSCGCADVDGVAGVQMSDLAVFANLLLSGGVCP